MSPFVLDFETGVIPGAAEFISGKAAPKSYKKDEAKKKYEEKSVEAELAEAALDIDLARIVAVAWKEPGMAAPAGYIAKTEDDERKLLKALTKRMRGENGPKTIVGHNVLDFDLLLYERRCLYLGVDGIGLELARFRHPRVVDTMQLLSYDGRKRYRGVDFYRKRFGIQVEDPYTGEDVGTLLLMDGKPTVTGEIFDGYGAVLSHCKADVETEYQIAVKLGIILEGQHAGLSLADQLF